jgi:hypothetical protein
MLWGNTAAWSVNDAWHVKSETNEWKIVFMILNNMFLKAFVASSFSISTVHFRALS